MMLVTGTTMVVTRMLAIVAGTTVVVGWMTTKLTRMTMVEAGTTGVGDGDEYGIGYVDDGGG